MPIDPGSVHKFFVAYSVPQDRLLEFVGAVSWFCVFVDVRDYAKGSRHARTNFAKRKKRLDFVLSYVKPGKEVMIGALFNVVRGYGYAQGYKTFCRDVAELGVLGKVETRVVRGGVEGNTTFFRLRRGSD